MGDEKELDNSGENTENEGSNATQNSDPADNNTDGQGGDTTQKNTNDEDNDQPPISPEEKARFFYEKRKAEKEKSGEVAPDQEVIKKVVEEQFGETLSSIVAQQQEFSKNKQVSDYFTKNDHLNSIENIEEMKTQALKWWGHDSRKHLPFEAVMGEVLGNNVIKVMQAGAAMANQANKEANKTKPMGSLQKAQAQKDYSQMSMKEIRELQQKNMYGQ